MIVTGHTVWQRWLSVGITALSAVGTVLAVAGCGDKCGKLYDMAQKCGKGKAKGPSRSDFVKECNKDKKQMKPLLDCAGAANCDKFIQCMKEKRKAWRKNRSALRAAGKEKKLEALLAKKDWDNFHTECAVLDNPGEKLKALCGRGQALYVNEGVKKAANAKGK